MRTVELRRNHFDAIIQGLCAPYGSVGCIADQLSNLFDIGFMLGASMFEELRHLGHDFRRTLRAVRTILRSSGIGELTFDWTEATIPRLEVHFKSDLTNQDYYSDAWVLDRGQDFEFIEQIARGVPLELSDAEGRAYFDGALQALHVSARRIKFSPVAWYVFGLTKGVLAGYLVSPDTTGPTAAEAMRFKIGSIVRHTGQNHMFRFELFFSRPSRDSHIH